MKEWSIDKSTINDCKGIAEFITIVWNETYKGIVNDKFLANLKESENQRWLNAENNFDENNNMQYLIKNNDGKIIGFLKLTKTDDNKTIEIQSLYLLKDYQKKVLEESYLKKHLKKQEKWDIRK